MEDGVVGEDDGNLISTKHKHGMLHWKDKLMKQPTYPKHLIGALGHNLLLNFCTRERSCAYAPEDKRAVEFVARGEEGVGITLVKTWRVVEKAPPRDGRCCALKMGSWIWKLIDESSLARKKSNDKLLKILTLGPNIGHILVFGCQAS